MGSGSGRRRGNRTTSSSKSVRHVGSRQTSLGSRVLFKETLSASAIIKQKTITANRLREQALEMTTAQRQALHDLRVHPQGPDEEWMDEVLGGNEPFDISHAGDEFVVIIDGLEDGLGNNRRRRHAADHRTRRDRTDRRTELFNAQIESLMDAYVDWSARDHAAPTSGPGYTEPCEDGSDGPGTYPVVGVDVFDTCNVAIPLFENDTLAVSIVRHGYMPCSPVTPSVVIATRAVELYRVTHLRSPHLSIQAYIKALCDLHGVPFRRYLSRQFSIAFDLYLSIRSHTHQRVQAALERDSPDWRLRHACPACTYKLKDERALLFAMLFAIDGNDSLKRIIRRILGLDENGTIGPSSELKDARLWNGNNYLPRSEVDKWSEEGIRDLMGEEAMEDDSEEDFNPCAERWRNMITELTKRMWGIFDETGIFVALCRHGFTLVLVDMVKSGEMAKYPLAIVDKMLRTFGKDLGGGYDIGCKFGATVKRSPLGKLAGELNYTSLVGAFHGHAHNRICQLSNLAMYVKGIGLEDLEGCERAFSRSNPLAPATRYSSVFHRMQAIGTYFDHTDTFDTYQALSTFLLNNYKQALEILASGPQSLKKAMEDLNIEDASVFDLWLEEERVYLKGLTKEPANEMLEMEYYQKLIDLEESKMVLAAANQPWITLTPELMATRLRDPTPSLETKRRHALEDRDKNLQSVQVLEIKLGIDIRWTLGCTQWLDTAKLVIMRSYQRALDSLEGLIVARMFELTKMNMSQTGYKLRKHIAKALQARSKAVRAAVERYNKAAAALTPPRPPLDWNDVVEYAFLANFDLLRDTRQDIRTRPWATPAGRLAMDLYFKLQRAQEEIERLNVEIPRVISYIHDEERYIQEKVTEVAISNEALAHQIRLHAMERGRFNAHHMHRFAEIAKLRGFSGSIQLGEHAVGNDEKGEAGRQSTVSSEGEERDVRMEGDVGQLPEEVELEEEEAGEEEEQEHIRVLFDVMNLSIVDT